MNSIHLLIASLPRSNGLGLTGIKSVHPEKSRVEILRDYQIVQTDSHLSKQVRVKSLSLVFKYPLAIFWQLSEAMIGDIWIDREIVGSFTVRDVVRNFRN